MMILLSAAAREFAEPLDEREAIHVGHVKIGEDKGEKIRGLLHPR